MIIGRDTVTYCMWGITGAGEAGIYESSKPLGSQASLSGVGPRLSMPSIMARGAGDNVITVEVRGDEVTWFVNGQLAKRYKVWSQNIRCNTVGLYVYGDQKVAFKSLKLSKW